MRKKQKSSVKQVSDSEPMITDFGTRKISNQNFSKMVAIPKTALINCGMESSMVNVKLVQQDGEKYEPESEL